jgi:hypothetical protein
MVKAGRIWGIQFICVVSIINHNIKPFLFEKAEQVEQVETA